MGGKPSKPDPSRSMEVISAGYGRTGTESMQLALERLLEGPVQHGGTNAINRTDGKCHIPHEPVPRYCMYARPAIVTIHAAPLLITTLIWTEFSWWGIQALQAQAAGDKELTKSYLRKMMAGYVAGTDFPTCVFVEELMEIYPNAKVRSGLY
jgi:hypothetical protein